MSRRALVARLRAVADLQFVRPGPADRPPETVTVSAGNVFTVDPGAHGQFEPELCDTAYRLIEDGLAEFVVGAVVVNTGELRDPRPVWLPKVKIRMRALGPVVTPVGERARDDEFDLPFETRQERELVLWGVAGGKWELAGAAAPKTWPAGHIRSTRTGAPS